MSLRLGQAIYAGEIPTAKVNSRCYGRDHHHCRILRHKEKRPAHAGVFGMKPRDKFGFGFRQIEWSPVIFRNAANQEDNETKWLIKNEPACVASLRHHNSRKAQGSRQHESAD